MSANICFEFVRLRFCDGKGELCVWLRDWSDRILIDYMEVQVEFVNWLRIAERWFQWKREMRHETVDGQHLGVFHLDSLRAIRRDGNHLCRKGRTALVFIVLLE